MTAPAWLANLKPKEATAAMKPSTEGEDDDDDDFFGEGEALQLGHSDAAFTSHLADAAGGKVLLTLKDTDDDDIFLNARRRKRGEAITAAEDEDELHVAELTDAQRQTGLKTRREAIRDGDRLAAYDTAKGSGAVATGKAVYKASGEFVESTENGVKVTSSISTLLGKDDEIVAVVAGAIDGSEVPTAVQTDYEVAGAVASDETKGAAKGKSVKRGGMKALAAAQAAAKAKASKITDGARQKRKELLAAAAQSRQQVAATPSATSSTLATDLSTYQGLAVAAPTEEEVSLDALGTEDRMTAAAATDGGEEVVGGVVVPRVADPTPTVAPAATEGVSGAWGVPRGAPEPAPEEEGKSKSAVKVEGESLQAEAQGNPPVAVKKKASVYATLLGKKK